MASLWSSPALFAAAFLSPPPAPRWLDDAPSASRPPFSAFAHGLLTPPPRLPEGGEHPLAPAAVRRRLEAAAAAHTPAVRRARRAGGQGEVPSPSVSATAYSREKLLSLRATGGVPPEALEGADSLLKPVPAAPPPQQQTHLRYSAAELLSLRESATVDEESLARALDALKPFKELVAGRGNGAVAAPVRAVAPAAPELPALPLPPPLAVFDFWSDSTNGDTLFEADCEALPAARSALRPPPPPCIAALSLACRSELEQLCVRVAERACCALDFRASFGGAEDGWGAGGADPLFLLFGEGASESDPPVVRHVRPWLGEGGAPALLAAMAQEGGEEGRALGWGCAVLGGGPHAPGWAAEAFRGGSGGGGSAFFLCVDAVRGVGAGRPCVELYHLRTGAELGWQWT